jgi:hypothetical protein
MNLSTRVLALASLLLIAPAFPVFAQQPAATTTAPALTAEQMENFLLNARIVRTRRAGDGITNSLRVTLSDGTLTHDAHVQSVDEAKPIFETPKGVELNFKDAYRYNIAGYRLARLLGMTNVPMSVERTVQGKPSAVTWWIDDVLFDEGDRMKKNDTGPNPSRFAMQVHNRIVFDELIQNTDRNLGNMVWTKDWTMWLIDHTRAFRMNDKLTRPERVQRVDRALLAAIKGLTRESVATAVGKTLEEPEIKALVSRAGELGKLFDQMIAQKGEPSVLFTLPR